MGNKSYHQQLMALFALYIATPAKLKAALKNADLHQGISTESWQFTLRRLHQQCAVLQPDLAALSDKEFRQLLYKNPTHAKVKILGGSLEIQQNLKRVEQNIFSLRRSAR